MGDIDLLVRRSALREADAGLRALGYVPERAPAAGDGDFLNAVLYARPGGGMPVHLHWDVANASLPHFMYRVDREEVWREAAGGELARHHVVVTLCEHALKHSYEDLICLTDVEIASRGVDWGEAARAARRWGLEPAVTCALVLLRDLMGVESPGLRHVRAGPPGVAGRAMLWMARRRRWGGLSSLGFLSMARGARAKARFVGQALAPRPSESGAFTSRSLGGRLRRAAGTIWGGI